VAELPPDARQLPKRSKMRIWVYYNPAASEAVVYENEPPLHFGRRQHDIGPVELDEDLVRQYDAAKAVWHEANSRFIQAVKTAQDSELIDW
jgi:hypothetical protein